MAMPVILYDKGTSRIAGIDGTEKGRWYLGFTCTECGANIYSVFDPANGQNARPVIGNGKFSVFCRACGADPLIYGTADFHPMQADRDIPGEAPPRKTPSNKARQELANKYKGASATFGPLMLERRPECAIIIARAISTWSYLETRLALLLTDFLKIETKQGLAVFLSIQSGRTQFDVLNAAAEVVLNPRDLEVFRALMNIKTAYEKARNDLVHGLFGYSPAVKDGVVWTAQKNLTSQTSSVWHALRTDAQPTTTADAFVYEAADLETIAQNFEWLHDHIGYFTGYTSIPEGDLREARYRQLCAESRLAKELRQMRAGQKNKQ
jgi:hypothetical protein